MIESQQQIAKDAKRRGRPQKKFEPLENEELLFTLHDNIFHASILFYTFRIFDKTPSKRKFNPTIGFSIYEKMKCLSPIQKSYYDEDKIVEQHSSQYQNRAIHSFFINCLTFGPICVVDQFFILFHHILRNSVTPQQCLSFIQDQKMKYINFNCPILDILEVKTTQKKKQLAKVIQQELLRLLEILIHTLDCLKSEIKNNIFIGILQSDEQLFERGIHKNSRKRRKLQ